ncbi:MAG TPA: M14 family zinc carboxypeptidase [Thermomicrobiales bacterium]|nr:M14 family zinc carboxypeptidase [Thermomicrobiales bacterium]
MPRAKISETREFLTTRTASERLGISPYLIKSRIQSGVFPPASRVTDGGVILVDEAWVSTVQQALQDEGGARVRRRRVAPPPITSPSAWLGVAVGADRFLPDWDVITGYFEQLAMESDRVSVEHLGTSTEGRPHIAVLISAPENLTEPARARNRELLGRLWDPVGRSLDEIDEAVEDACPVGIIMATQHSNEIGACLMTLELAHQLAVASDADTTELLSRIVTVLIPSQNPDGVQLVADWYRRTLRTEYEGSEMPWLYHRYVGHDNNRDWFMLTQRENQSYVAFHNREHPQLVFDMHQMYRDGARFMVPPFIDPLDPNQDPVIQQQFAAVGSAIASRLTAAGKAGVVTHAMFDNYSPSLAYGNYHGSVDLLSEAASCRYATPVDIREADLKKDDRFAPTVRSWNHPLPWKGGRWTLRDIVEYDLIAARAALDHLARNRTQWLTDYVDINRRSSRRDEAPYAFVIPGDEDQHDPGTARELIDVLRRGIVRVDIADQPVTLDGVEYPTGTRVVLLDQPAGTFAKTLLEIQEYPNLRKWPDGPPQAPYDIAGHTLPLQMGVRASAIRTPVTESARLALRPLDRNDTVPGTVDAEAPAGYAFVPDANASIRVISRLLRAGRTVRRVTGTTVPDLPPGTVVVEAGDDLEDQLTALAHETGISFRAIPVGSRPETVVQRMPRIALYQSWSPSIDEGWTRWILEEYEVPASTVHDADIRRGQLNDRFDVIVLPHQSASDLVNGNPSRNKYDEPYPPEYVGGLGAVGMDELQRFTERGGTLIALDGTATPVIDRFALPVRNVLQGLKDTEFYCPGSLLRVVVDTRHPLGWGLRRDTTVLFYDSPAFEALTGTDRTTTVARYPAGGTPNQSGWILGDQHLRSRSALVEVELGQGRVILVGFRAQFRAQARGTYKVLFNALFRAGQEPSA